MFVEVGTIILVHFAVIGDVTQMSTYYECMQPRRESQ